MLKVPTIVLEAVASYDLWIWHARVPQRHQHLGFITSFHRFNEWGHPSMRIQSQWDNLSPGIHYLADGIYPDYSTLIKTISHPQGLERKVCRLFYKS
jgi:hypothetical protein